jgi:hypothetical protein
MKGYEIPETFALRTFIPYFNEKGAMWLQPTEHTPEKFLQLESLREFIDQVGSNMPNI